MSKADAYTMRFRFAMKESVEYEEHPHTRFTIQQRRWTERTLVDPIVEYRLSEGKHAKKFLPEWVDERDLKAWISPD